MNCERAKSEAFLKGDESSSREILQDYAMNYAESFVLLFKAVAKWRNAATMKINRPLRVVFLSPKGQAASQTTEEGKQGVRIKSHTTSEHFSPTHRNINLNMHTAYFV